MDFKTFFLFIAFALCAVRCQPIENVGQLVSSTEHTVWKRFINPSLTFGDLSNNGISNIRTKRSAAEDCEKLQLCKLHARSSRNFFAAFELYFVNKENARLWDHRARSMADCEQRYSCYR